jgi:SAM-dependent methyltransferase
MQMVELAYIHSRLGELGCAEPVLELGAGRDVEFHRTPFRKRKITKFYAHDIIAYPGVRLDFVGNLCNGVDIPKGFGATVLLFNVLEHVYAPWLAVDEVYRVLRPGGLLLGSVPMRTAIHRHDRDYWRFCPDGLAYLLRRFRLVHFALDGNCAMPANMLFAAVKDEAQADWHTHNQSVVLQPEVILKNDYTTVKWWKKRLLDLMRRCLGLTIELWVGPWNARRMQELGFEAWTVREYVMQ